MEGRAFHYLAEDGNVLYQGQVLADIKWGKYLVQLFSYLTGAPTFQIVISFDDGVVHPNGQTKFQFFDDMEAAGLWLDAHMDGNGKASGGAKL